MTVKELIETLQKFDPRMEVEVGSGDVYPGPFLIEEFIVNDGFKGAGETHLAIAPIHSRDEIGCSGPYLRPPAGGR